jgi:NADH:ubiquinone oxidoreductase subunit F (NADH-binding)
MIMTETRRVDRDRIDPDHALALLRDTRLTGHGGGAFPTATKISGARGHHPDVIVNACDGEPLVQKDTALLRHRPMLVADGIAVLQTIVRPRRTLIAVHADSPAEESAYQLIAAGRIRAEVLPVPDRYVSSEASALASLAANGEGRPRYHQKPLAVKGLGRRARPILVLNAETVARVAAVWLDHGRTPTRLVTVAGDLSRPGVLEAPLSATVGELVAAGRPTGRPRAVLIGGYGGRWFAWDDAEGRALHELGRELGAGLVMVDAHGCPVRTVGEILGYLADQSAGQCGPCMFGLPAIAADWQLLLDPHRATEAARRLRRRLPTISGRGACHHPDGAVTMAASALEVFADHIAAHRQGHCVRANVPAGVS